MPIFELEPIDLNHADWRASTHKGKVIVRAPDEKAARWAATVAFRIATLAVPGQVIPDNPWRTGRGTKATVLENSDWPADGPPEILSPEHHNDLLRGVNWEAVQKM